MVAKRGLRAVAADEKPKKPARPMTLEEAVESGNYLEILLAQRREMVAALPGLSGPAVPAQHRQLSAISKDIAALQVKDAEDTEGGADVDDEEFSAEAI